MSTKNALSLARAMNHSPIIPDHLIPRYVYSGITSKSAGLSRNTRSSTGFTYLADDPTRQHSHRSFGSWPKIRPLRIRAISMDVTGTLVSFRGSLSQHYVKSAEKCGVLLPKTIQFDHAFKTAYREISQSYPCFGHNTITGKEWWRHCVIRSFEVAGATMTDVQKDRVFQRIYSIFGSQAAYERFDDAVPFLRWANRNHIVCGLLSNADERYGDSILPMLGLTHDEIQFQCFSKYYGFEKPDHRIFAATIKRAEDSLREMSCTVAQVENTSVSDAISDTSIDPLLPSQCLHIGNDYTKDFEGARRAGMHAVLLDRYDEPELAAEWRRRGAIVWTDLMDIVEFLGRTNCQLGNSPSKDSSNA
jgi:putative hydrolase of the HAD superfamily